MVMKVINATMASAASDQSTFVTELIISTPTQIRAVAVALLGMSWAMGLRNMATIKHTPVMKEVKPVLPPATTPEEDSTGAYGVEHIYHAQRKCGSYQHNRQRTAVIGAGGEVLIEVEAFIEHHAHRVRAPGFERVYGVGQGYVVEHIYRALRTCAHRYARKDIIKDRRPQQAPQYRALYVLFGQHRYYHHADKRDYRGENAAHGAVCIGHERGIVEQIEGYESGQSRRFVYYDARLLQADKRYKQTYAHGDRVSDARGNGFENLAPESRKGEYEENNAVYEHEHHTVCVSQTRFVEQGKHDKGVNAHSGGLRKRHSCQKSH